MSAPHINLSFVLSVHQKLSKLIDFWRSSDKNNFAQFFWDTVYNTTVWVKKYPPEVFWHFFATVWEKMSENLRGVFFDSHCIIMSVSGLESRLIELKRDISSYRGLSVFNNNSVFSKQINIIQRWLGRLCVHLDVVLWLVFR